MNLRPVELAISTYHVLQSSAPPPLTASQFPELSRDTMLLWYRDQ